MMRIAGNRFQLSSRFVTRVSKLTPNYLTQTNRFLSSSSSSNPLSILSHFSRSSNDSSSSHHHHQNENESNSEKNDEKSDNNLAWGWVFVTGTIMTLYVSQLVGPQPDLPDYLRPESIRNSKSSKNHSLVFIKPNASTPQTEALFHQVLENNGITILDSGVLSGREIDEKNIIDKHFAVIAESAMSTEPSQLIISQEKKKEFQNKFGISWDKACSTVVFNANDCCWLLGLSPQELNQRWIEGGRENKYLKLSPGVSISYLKDGIFVINGFYPAMKLKYTQPNSIIRWFIVSFNSNRLSYSDFRSKVIGSTDPNQANSSSVRGLVLKDWKKLGLESKPTVEDNVVHASASSLEALKEHVLWLGYGENGEGFERDLFGFDALIAGVSREDLVKRWLRNEVIELNGVKAPIFDHVEEKNNSEIIQILLNSK